MKNIQVVVSLLLLTRITIAQDSNCFSLQGSTACPAFSSFYLSTTGSQSTYPFLANVSNVESFDTALSNYVTSSEFLDECSTIPKIRYAKSYMCAILVQDSTYSLPCNYQYNKSPPPLCQSTCFDYTASVCPDQAASLNSTCQSWSGLNGTTDCIIGLANEPEYCGFNSESDACNYCQSNSDDSCCQLVSGCHRLSTGAIIGIIIGVLVFVGCLGAVFWFANKKRKHQKSREHDQDGLLGGYESQNTLLDHSTTPQPPQQQQQQLEEFYEVKHPYPPQMGDELGLNVGDIVCVAMNFDDGWALGFNVTTGLKGVFPIVCVTPVPEELLEQLLDQPTNKILVEDHDSTANIPKRTASIMHRSKNSSFNEAIEMHRSNKRVSKLQQEQ